MLIGEYPTPQEIELAYRSLIIAMISTFILSIIIFKLVVRSDFYKSLVPIQSQLKNCVKRYFYISLIKANTLISYINPQINEYASLIVFLIDF